MLRRRYQPSHLLVPNPRPSADLKQSSSHPSRSTNERSNDLDPSSRPIHLLSHQSLNPIRVALLPLFVRSLLRLAPGGTTNEYRLWLPPFTSISGPHPGPACYRPISSLPLGRTKRDGRMPSKPVGDFIHK